MGRVQWQMPQMRFLRGAPHGTARRFDANGTQRTYRCYSARTRTGSKLNRRRGGVILPRRKREELLQRLTGRARKPLTRHEITRATVASASRLAGRRVGSAATGRPRRRHVSFDCFMFGVLKQIVWQIERNFLIILPGDKDRGPAYNG
jgi:hypothetical protein